MPTGGIVRGFVRLWSGKKLLGSPDGVFSMGGL